MSCLKTKIVSFISANLSQCMTSDWSNWLPVTKTMKNVGFRLQQECLFLKPPVFVHLTAQGVGHLWYYYKRSSQSLSKTTSTQAWAAHRLSSDVHLTIYGVWHFSSSAVPLAEIVLDDFQPAGQPDPVSDIPKHRDSDHQLRRNRCRWRGRRNLNCIKLFNQTNEHFTYAAFFFILGVNF